MADGRVEALIAFPDSGIFGQRDNIVQSALRSSLPGVYLQREWVAAGGLLAYGPNQASIRLWCTKLSMVAPRPSGL